MNIEKRSVGEVTVLDLNGRLTMEHEGLLWDEVNTLIRNRKPNVLLNLAELSYCDSAGLGEIVRSLVTVSRNRGKLKLLSPSKRFRHLLTVTGLGKMFEIHENEKDAVESF